VTLNNQECAPSNHGENEENGADTRQTDVRRIGACGLAEETGHGDAIPESSPERGRIFVFHF
jgi:hypothetical protein